MWANRIVLWFYKYLLVIIFPFILKNKPIDCLVHFLSFLIFLYKRWLSRIKSISLQFSYISLQFPSISIKNHRVHNKEWKVYELSLLCITFCYQPCLVPLYKPISFIFDFIHSFAPNRVFTRRQRGKCPTMIIFQTHDLNCYGISPMETN